MGLLDYFVDYAAELAGSLRVGGLGVEARNRVAPHDAGQRFAARYRPHLARHGTLCCARGDFVGVCQYAGVDLGWI